MSYLKMFTVTPKHFLAFEFSNKYPFLSKIKNLLGKGSKKNYYGKFHTRGGG